MKIRGTFSLILNAFLVYGGTVGVSQPRLYFYSAVVRIRESMLYYIQVYSALWNKGML